MRDGRTEAIRGTAFPPWTRRGRKVQERGGARARARRDARARVRHDARSHASQLRDVAPSPGSAERARVRRPLFREKGQLRPSKPDPLRSDAFLPALEAAGLFYNQFSC